MSLPRLPCMELPEAQRLPLRFLWDDARASRDFRHDAGGLVAAVRPLSMRAQIAVCIGLYEWVAWRFDGLQGDAAPLQVAEAAWCASVHPDWMPYFELSRAAWSGPVRGPLWCAATWLLPAVTEADHNRTPLADGLRYLARLAMHVAAEPARVQAWVDAVLPRLAALHPAEPFDPCDDLFDQRLIERRGPLVGREALDPALPYDPRGAGQALGQLLRGALADRNPFLAERVVPPVR